MRLVHSILTLMNLVLAHVANAFPLVQDGSAVIHTNVLVQDNERALFGVCEGPVQFHYFEVSIRIIPGNQTGSCTVADQVFLGNDLNQLLFNFGIGETGVGNDLYESESFVAAVCPLPSTSFRRNLILSSRAFIWTGGGGCRLCLADNLDHRRSLRAVTNEIGARYLQSTQVDSSDWFANVYAPGIESAIEAAILQYVVPNHEPCLGLFPSVDVKLEEITLADLNLDCDDGTIIESLMSLNLAESSLKTRNCGICKSLDFSRSGNNDILKGGDYVRDEWKVTHGVEVSATGGYTPDFKARIFDTGNTVCITSEGKLDFGSPNKSCIGGGIGEGSGGSTGESGQNCRSIGNVLIIQDSNKDCPDASSNGGSLKFTWDKPVLVSDVGLMDIDEENQRLKFTFADGFVESFTYKSFGDNAVQRVVANKINVMELEVVLSGTGAVTEINFCPACDVANETIAHDVDHHCIYDNNRQFAKPEAIIAYDDFESSSSLIGWSNGKLDDQEQGGFTTFLGRYTRGMDPPFKTYTVPKEAESIIITVDFYEIDGWDSSEDTAQVYIDGDLIDFGTSKSFIDEGHQEGITNLGIFWRVNSTTPPLQLGYNATRLDQKFEIEMSVPQTSGLYEDGRLRLTLKTSISESEKSAGWDNIKVVGQFNCDYQEMSLNLMESCSANEHFNDFEGSEALSGWINGRIEAGEQNAFTKFLGRYALADASPEKTFTVPITADKIILDVDFYEIDSWDAWPDTAAIYIDGEKIDLGGFNFYENEGLRFGTTRAGLFWQLESLTDPAQLGFGNRSLDLDQKHRVRIEIPKTSGLFDDGKLQVKLSVNLNSGVDDESGGWDNINITSRKNCNERPNESIRLPSSKMAPSCNETILLIDDFEGNDALSGWTNGKLESGGQSNFTKFLGRYASGDASPEKTFAVPSSAFEIIFEVDFYEIDSWDAWPDAAAINIDGEKINLGAFHWRGDEGHRFGTTSAGLFWQMESLIDPGQLGFRRRRVDLDQKHRVSIKIPKISGLFDDGKLHVKLEVNLDSGIDDESGGWDNIIIKSGDETCQSSLINDDPVDPLLTTTCNERSIIINDFESVDALSGWSNSKLETGEQHNFTKFLGRYIFRDASPEKIFAVPTTAGKIIFEVDFYEIDSWDSWPDTAAIYIGGEKIDLGGFHSTRDEGFRSGSTSGGLSWQLDSLTDPRQLGFGKRSFDLDQKHRVRIEIPKLSGLFDDGNLYVKLVVNAGSRIQDESGGWDNLDIKIVDTTCLENLIKVSPSPTLTPTCDEKTVFIDDFESFGALSGWTNGKLETGEKRAFTNFLGRYAFGDASPEKTYAVPTTADQIIFEVDFYEIDSWDAWPDTAAIYIDGKKINLGAFHWRGDEGHKVGTTSTGLFWQLDSLTDPTQLGFDNRVTALDQKHRVRIEIPKASGLFGDGKLHVKLEVNLQSRLSDESGGWDNIKIKSVDKSCRKSVNERAIATVPTPVPTSIITPVPTSIITPVPTSINTPVPTSIETSIQILSSDLVLDPPSLLDPAPVPMGFPICKLESLAFDDFEGSFSLFGWSNGKLETGEQVSFTKFLGRYSSSGFDPEKTFTVPTTADDIIFEVDFYEIDSWDAWPDTAAIYIDGEKINLGGFDSKQDEGQRYGMTDGGLFWQLDSLTYPAQLGFGTRPIDLDQKHRVRIEIPKASGLFDDGKLHVKLVVSLDFGVDDESGGWDNINITSRKNCNESLKNIALLPATTMAPTCIEKLILINDFENDLARFKWTNGKVEDREQASFTKFLGRYASGDASPEKTFAVPSTANTIIFEVDFYEIDSWDAWPDAAAIYIDGEKINLGTFHWRGDEGHRFGTTRAGLFWQLDSLTDPTRLGFGNGKVDLDQKHRVRIEIPKASGLFDDRKLHVKLEVNLQSGINDESGGWDNIKFMSANTACRASAQNVDPIPAPLVTTTCNETSILINNFEGFFALFGWSNGKVESREQSAFTKFLGRYASGDASPEKTFAVPSTAGKIVFEVDFYEIDSWDAWPDAAAIYIDEEKIDLGGFDAQQDEGLRFGTTDGGLLWQLDSLTNPAELGFGNRTLDLDQKHRVRIEIPKASGLFDDGKLQVKLVVNVDLGVDDESGGWDNINIKVVDQICLESMNGASPAPTPTRNTMCNETEIFLDDFEAAESVLSSWTNGKLESGQQSNSNFTNFLGRFSSGDGSPEKTFAVPTTADQIIFEVDFYEIDSWDAWPDNVAIYIGGEKISLGTFHWRGDEGRRSGTNRAGLFWQLDSLTDPAQLGFGKRKVDLDQKHRVRIEIPKTSGFFDDGKLHVKLEVNLESGLRDESGGWDNIRVLSRNTCLL